LSWFIENILTARLKLNIPFSDAMQIYQVLDKNIVFVMIIFGGVLQAAFEVFVWINDLFIIAARGE